MLSQAKTRGLILAALVPAAVLGGLRTAAAADLDVYQAPAAVSVGVPCDSPLAQSMPSVWLGHFTGGASQYSGPGGSIFLDWRNEKLCFPTHRSCGRWIAGMRRDFHHPEGYFTCLAIR